MLVRPSEKGGVLRWGAVGMLGVMLLALGAAGCGGGSDSSGEVGVAKAPANAVELVGRFDQVGAAVRGYGFLTHVSGLADGALFAGGSSLFSAASGATEKDALLTFSFDTSLVNRSINQPIIDVGQQGTIDFYFNKQPVADFSRPDSFATGQKIASGSLATQDLLNVFAPNRGIATGTGSLVENSTSSFDLGGATHELGHDGLAMRVFITGQGTRTKAFPPHSTFDFGGNLTVSGG